MLKGDLMNRTISLGIKVIMCVCVIVGCYCGLGGRTVERPSKATISIGQFLEPRDMKEDFDFLLKTICEVHPSTNTLGQNKDLVADVYEQIKNPMSIADFYFQISKIFSLFHDGHTRINATMFHGERILNVPIYWTNDYMMITENTTQFNKGDIIHRIAGFDKDAILQYLRDIVPSENDNWVKAVGTKIILRESVLKHLTGQDAQDVDFEIERNGKLALVKVPYTPMDQADLRLLNYSSPYKQIIDSYQIDKDYSYGIYKLDEFILNEDFERRTRDFFMNVIDQGVSNIILDVRDNVGGDSRCIDEILKYTNINGYNNFGSITRNSEQLHEQRGIASAEPYTYHNSIFQKNYNHKFNKLFDGKIIVFVSKLTFSSANWLGTIIQDNKLGTIIGEPTGNSPTSYGDPLYFTLPVSKMRFQVSHKKWLRPVTINEQMDALYPDIILYPSMSDIVNHRDVHLDYVKSTISRLSDSP